MKSSDFIKYEATQSITSKLEAVTVMANFPSNYPFLLLPTSTLSPWVSWEHSHLAGLLHLGVSTKPSVPSPGVRAEMRYRWDFLGETGEIKPNGMSEQ